MLTAGSGNGEAAGSRTCRYHRYRQIFCASTYWKGRRLSTRIILGHLTNHVTGVAGTGNCCIGKYDCVGIGRNITSAQSQRSIDGRASAQGCAEAVIHDEIGIRAGTRQAYARQRRRTTSRYRYRRYRSWRHPPVPSNQIIIGKGQPPLIVNVFLTVKPLVSSRAVVLVVLKTVKFQTEKCC